MTIAMNERQLIEQKDAQIKRSVRNFVRKQVGYGSIKSDRDDLYQECAVHSWEISAFGKKHWGI